MSVLEKRVGELRPTQLIHSFGVGSIIELPHFSAMLMGLDDWPVAHCRSIIEDRLLDAVQRSVGAQVERLVAPPFDAEPRAFFSPGDSAVGLPVATFPRYLRCPFCHLLAPVDRFRVKTTPARPDKARWVHMNCQKAKEPSVLPARFLFACENGHLDDFPWHEYVHRGPSKCASDLRLEEYGGSGEATDVRVICAACNSKPRVMADAFDRTTAMPPCRGRRPHLRDFEAGGCTERASAILLGASNLWFAVSLSALHIPHATQNVLGKLVEDHWSVLAKAKSVDVLEFLRDDGKLGAFEAFPLGSVFAAIEQRRAGTTEAPATDLKVPEWEAFERCEPSQQNRDFELEETSAPAGYERWFTKTVLARRIREVTALTGFTRIGSPRDYANVNEVPGNVRMKLARTPPRFVPASEVRGEGIFLRFNEDVLGEWCAGDEARERAFLTAHAAWRKRRGIEPPEGSFPGSRFVVIHSFSHALMRQLSLECGYSAASLRERIYAMDEDSKGPRMAGLLIYTAAPDSEGTLGGLVRMGKPSELGRHIRRALEEMRLCSSDPLCADHVPDPDGMTLHAAACHACLFAPETSCERGNRYLDRGTLVTTVHGGPGFFDPARDG